MSLVRVLSLALLAACELQPPPKQAPAPAQTAEPPGPPAPTDSLRPPTPPAGAGSAALEVTDDCVKVGAHVANVIIANASDPAQRSILEQERTKMVRATAEACTTQAWSEDAARCYLDTRTPAELEECEKKFTPPRPPTRAPVAPPPEAGGMRPVPGAAPAGTQPAQPGTEPPAETQPTRRPTRTRPAQPGTRPAQPARPARQAGTRPADRQGSQRMRLKPPPPDPLDEVMR